jgi:hypothetical protein
MQAGQPHRAIASGQEALTIAAALGEMGLTVMAQLYLDIERREETLELRRRRAMGTPYTYLRRGDASCGKYSSCRVW